MASGPGARRAPAGPCRVAPVRVRTTSAAGGGQVTAGSAVVALNAWAAAWPSFGRRLVTWSSYIVLTEPIPDRLADIGWTGGEGLADNRFTLHYLRTTPDGRIAIGGGGGRAGFGGRIGPAFTDDAQSTSRAAAGLRRLFPSLRDVRIEDAWGGPIDITADHLPTFASVPGRPIHFGHGYSGNGVGAVGRGRADPGGAGGRGATTTRRWRRRSSASLPRAFPPEPFRYAGARVVREAIVRREQLEEQGRPVNPILREVTRLPKRLGYHLGHGLGADAATAPEHGIGRFRVGFKAPAGHALCIGDSIPRAGVPVNSRPPVKPANGAVEPFKHVIDEYKHQAQTITCTCGWHGSSATVDRSGFRVDRPPHRGSRQEALTRGRDRGPRRSTAPRREADRVRHEPVLASPPS